MDPNDQHTTTNESALEDDANDGLVNECVHQDENPSADAFNGINHFSFQLSMKNNPSQY